MDQHYRNLWLPQADVSATLVRLIVTALVLAFAAALVSPGHASASGAEVVHEIDFTDRPDGEALSWLRDKGYDIRLDGKALEPRFTDKGLVLSTEQAQAGLFARELEVRGADRIRVTWGVDRYPKGADWENGIYRCPVAVMVSFGDEKIDSGSMFVPSAPYFLSVFLSKNAEPGKGYTANFYQEGGRYYCEPCTPTAGETVITELDLDRAFRESFGESGVPPITSFSFQMNTDNTRGGASAYIRRVELLARASNAD